jgi:hypothetical protein
MNDDVMNKLSAVDWDDAAPRLLAFARRWAAGLYNCSEGGALPNGMSIEDVVKDAVAAFASGERRFNPHFEIMVQLKGAIRSILWNIHKRKAAGLTSSEEPAFLEAQLDESLDPAAKAESEDFCRMFLENLAGDKQVQKSPELLAIVKAYAGGAESVQELVEHVGLPAQRVYELRRQMREIAARVLRHLNRKERTL